MFSYCSSHAAAEIIGTGFLKGCGAQPLSSTGTPHPNVQGDRVISFGAGMPTFPPQAAVVGFSMSDQSAAVAAPTAPAPSSATTGAPGKATAAPSGPVPTGRKVGDKGTFAQGGGAKAVVLNQHEGSQYLAGVTLSANQVPTYQGIASAFQRGSVHPTIGRVAIEFFSGAKGAVAVEQKNHNFDLTRSGFKASSPAVVALGNRLAAAGANQADVDRLFSVIREQRAQREVAQAQEQERYDSEDFVAAQNWMRTEYGNDAKASARLLDQYVANLPPAEQQKLRSERNADGLAAIHDPKRLRELVKLATSTGKSAQMSREEIEGIVRTDRRRYNEDDLMQHQYRALLRNGGSAEAKAIPANQAKVEAEIAGIEQFIRTNSKAYFADEAKQFRLRKLYAARGG